MAGQDELTYKVRFVVDEGSFSSIQEALNQLENLGKTSFAGGTVQSSKDLAEALDSVATAADNVKDVMTTAEQSQRVFDKAAVGSTTSLAELNAQIEQNKQTIRELTAIDREAGQVIGANATEIEALKVANKELQSEYRRQQKEVGILNSDLFATAHTYRELEDQNKALALAMKQVPLNDTSGQLQALQAQYNANNDALKDFDEKLGNHQRNVGNYGSIWEDVGGTFKEQVGAMNPLLGTLTSGLGMSTAGVKALKTALITSGIGAIVVGIGTAFSMLTSAMQTFQPVIDSVNRVTAQLSAGFGSLAHNAAVFFGIIDEEYVSITDTIKAAGELADAQAALELSEVRLIETRARLRKESAEARLEAQDEEKSVEERQQALERAIRAEQQLGRAQVAVAQQRYDLAVANNALTHSNTEDLRTEAEAYANLMQVQEETASRMRELIGTRKTLADQAAKQVADFDVELQALLEANLITQSEQYVSQLNEQGAFMLAAAEQLLFERSEMEKRYREQGFTEEEAAGLATVALKYREIELLNEAERRQTDFMQQQAEAQMAIRQSVVDSVLGTAGALFEESKAVAIADTIVNTWRGAQAAFAETAGPLPVKLAAAAAAVAAGIANVRKITQTKVGDTSAQGGGTSSRAGATPVRTVAEGAMNISFGTGLSRTLDDLATYVAGQQGAGSTQPQINVEATVDRKGIAIAVRDGNKEIESEQIVYQ